jgi:TorA maturation chaperone TorD
MTKHLGSWGPRLAEHVADKATTPFYRTMATVLSDFLALECDLFAISVAQ